MNLQDIEKLTEGRKELENLAKQKLQVLVENEKELKKLDKERQILQDIKIEKELFLNKREKEALDKLAEVNEGLDKSGSKVKEIGQEVESFIGNLTETAENIIKKAEGVADKTESILNQTKELEKVWEMAVEGIKLRLSKADELLIKNSDFEKELTKQKKEVELKSMVAEEKLKRAEDLVFWHSKKGEKLTV